MREYYLLKDDHRIIYKVDPPRLDLPKSFNQLPSVSVIPVDQASDGQYLDWLSKPWPMMSDEMKNILSLYNPQMEYKQVDLIDRKNYLQHTYWSFYVPPEDCLSPKTDFYPNGSLKSLVVDREKIKKHHFISIQGIREPLYLVSLDAAESLLRRELTGFILESVSQAGGDLDE
ncbi:hypothetical protein [Paenibacillus sp.]|jgi:hypothetical protein|uniref:hypothetical protein n=1 Tax=Paenibacillus sp. TaxID=58172 RepID=UPI00281FC232|nr:hypothetical protein [Paenibacillus sp.]MDR0266765.1 hypothetical protein [Paenibacillus sp.]